MTAPPEQEIARVPIEMRGLAMLVTHNLSCWCCAERKAIFQCHTGRFQPCWTCQADGYRTIRYPRWLQWLIEVFS